MLSARCKSSSTKALQERFGRVSRSRNRFENKYKGDNRQKRESDTSQLLILGCSTILVTSVRTAIVPDHSTMSRFFCQPCLHAANSFDSMSEKEPARLPAMTGWVYCTYARK